MTTKLSTAKLVPMMNENKIRYSVSLTTVIEGDLTYEESQKLEAELIEQYLGKEVDLDLSPTPTGHRGP